MSHEQFQNCIDECLRCMQACNHCYDACLTEEHSMDMSKCIRLDRECADICAFAAQAMSHNSSYAKQLCRLCAEVCEACGNECKQHEHDHCQRCAEACFACAEACRKMAAQEPRLNRIVTQNRGNDHAVVLPCFFGFACAITCYLGQWADWFIGLFRCGFCVAHSAANKH